MAGALRWMLRAGSGAWASAGVASGGLRGEAISSGCRFGASRCGLVHGVLAALRNRPGRDAVRRMDCWRCRRIGRGGERGAARFRRGWFWCLGCWRGCQTNRWLSPGPAHSACGAFWCMGFCYRCRKGPRRRFLPRCSGRRDQRYWCTGSWLRCCPSAVRRRGGGSRVLRLLWCKGSWRHCCPSAVRRRRGGSRVLRLLWCKGSWQPRRRCGECDQSGAGGAPGLSVQRDGLLPRREGRCLGALDGAVLRHAGAGGRVPRHLQFPRPLVVTGLQVRRQPVEAIHDRPQHLAAAHPTQDTPVVGAPLRAVAAVDGAGGAQPGHALRSAGAGAAAAMHAAAEFSVNRRGAAGAARARACAATRGHGEVGVAAAFTGRRGGRGLGR